jgi:hypothetical protein
MALAQQSAKASLVLVPALQGLERILMDQH